MDLNNTQSFDVKGEEENVLDELTEAEVGFIIKATGGWLATAWKSEEMSRTEKMDKNDSLKDFSTFVSYFVTDNHRAHEIDTYSTRLSRFMDGNYSLITRSCGIREGLIDIIENEEIDKDRVGKAFDVIGKYSAKLGDRYFWNNLKVKRDNFNSAYVDRIIQSDEQWGDLSKNEKIALTILREGMKFAENRLPEIQGDVHHMNS